MEYKPFLILIGISAILGLIAGTDTLLGKIATFLFNITILIFAGSAIWALVSGGTDSAIRLGLSAVSIVFGAGIGFFIVKSFKS